jgi:hemerythrin
MAIIQWNDSLSVNIMEIDSQHQKLIGMINDLDDAMSQGKGKTILGRIIYELVDYTDKHFGLEEKYFNQFGYPEANHHKQAHSVFTKKIATFKNALDKDKFGLSIEIVEFLSDWLQNHIKTVDKKYETFFNENGLK